MSLFPSGFLSGYKSPPSLLISEEIEVHAFIKHTTTV